MPVLPTIWPAVQVINFLPIEKVEKTCKASKTLQVVFRKADSPEKLRYVQFRFQVGIQCFEEILRVEVMLICN